MYSHNVPTDCFLQLFNLFFNKQFDRFLKPILMDFAKIELNILDGFFNKLFDRFLNQY